MGPVIYISTIRHALAVNLGPCKEGFQFAFQSWGPTWSNCSGPAYQKGFPCIVSWRVREPKAKLPCASSMSLQGSIQNMKTAPNAEWPKYTSFSEWTSLKEQEAVTWPGLSGLRCLQLNVHKWELWKKRYSNFWLHWKTGAESGDSPERALK